MKWIFRTLPLAVIILLYAAFRPAPHAALSLYTYSYENVLGTSFDLKLQAHTEPQADAAEALALQEIDRLNALLSTYDPHSEFSRWQQSSGVYQQLSPELFDVLALFDSWKSKTGGALDPAAAAVIQVWKQAEANGITPDAKSLAAATQATSQRHWILNPASGAALHLTKTPLVLNSFVKSYIIQQVADKLMTIDGVEGVLVNIGGDMVAAGTMQETVSITDPLAIAENDPPAAVLALNKRAIATSGNYRRGFTINGQWYSHIVDPRTARPVSEVISATVVSPSAVTAGALATAFNILSPEETIKLAADHPEAEYLVIRRNGTVQKSKGWDQLALTTPARPSIKSSPSQKAWNPQYELAVTLELKRFEGRSRRPFVAVWVENPKKETVRTIALWFNKPRWVPDLKEWFRKNSGRYQNGPKDMYSISSATRAPGSYTLKWDGMNDDSTLVKPDTYTVYIEVVREHGGYEILKQEVNCKGKPVQFNLPGSVEIEKASVEFRKIADK